MQKLRQLKPGTWFTKKPIEEPDGSQVWVKDYYDRSVNKYVCYRWSDINDYQYISGDKIVYTDFTF